jgi:hypothetical protein
MRSGAAPSARSSPVKARAPGGAALPSPPPAPPSPSLSAKSSASAAARAAAACSSSARSAAAASSSSDALPAARAAARASAAGSRSIQVMFHPRSDSSITALPVRPRYFTKSLSVGQIVLFMCTCSLSWMNSLYTWFAAMRRVL